GSHGIDQCAGKLLQCRLYSGRHVADDVGGVTRRGEEIGAGDIIDEYEVHGMASIAIDERRLPAYDALHPSHEDLYMGASYVHAWTVDIEIAERDVVEAIFVVEAPKQAFFEHLGCAVQGSTAVRMMILTRRESLGHPVHRSRRRGDDLGYSGSLRGLDNVERPIDHDFKREPRIPCTVGKPYRGLMEHNIDPLGDLCDECGIADVTVDDRHLAAVEAPREILLSTACEVVHDHDFGRLQRHELIRDGGSDQAGAACDQHTCVTEIRAR